MQKTLTGAAIAVALFVGLLIGRGTTTSQPESAAGDSEREVLYWVAPMDANFRRDEPGKSPMGMDLVPVYADEIDAQPDTIRIDPVYVNNLGVKTARAEQGSLPRIVDTVGYVGFDEETMQHIHTRVEGWIQDLAVTTTGDPIEAGQLLFSLYSPALVNAQEEYLAALRTGNDPLTRASADRLLALGLARDDVAALTRDRKVKQHVDFVARQSGVVSHLGVREGMFVTPATELLSWASLDTVWVHAEVFERQSSWVSAGQRAVVTLDYDPGTELAGIVDYVYPSLDPETRTLKVRLRFENPGLLLKPNMFASVRIDGRPTGPIVHVPREAVIRDGETSRVVLDLGDGRFRATRVRLGIESGERIAVREGLDAGDRIVVAGQFLIDSESNASQALEGLAPAAVGPKDESDAMGSDMTHHGYEMPE